MIDDRPDKLVFLKQYVAIADKVLAGRGHGVVDGFARAINGLCLATEWDFEGDKGKGQGALQQVSRVLGSSEAMLLAVSDPTGVVLLDMQLVDGLGQENENSVIRALESSINEKCAAGAYRELVQELGESYQLAAAILALCKTHRTPVLVNSNAQDELESVRTRFGFETIVLPQTGRSTRGRESEQAQEAGKLIASFIVRTRLDLVTFFVHPPDEAERSNVRWFERPTHHDANHSLCKLHYDAVAGRFGFPSATSLDDASLEAAKAICFMEGSTLIKDARRKMPAWTLQGLYPGLRFAGGLSAQSILKMPCQPCLPFLAAVNRLMDVARCDGWSPVLESLDDESNVVFLGLCQVTPGASINSFRLWKRTWERLGHSHESTSDSGTIAEAMVSAMHGRCLTSVELENRKASEYEAKGLERFSGVLSGVEQRIAAPWITETRVGLWWNDGIVLK